jgi:hypothetical protein
VWMGCIWLRTVSSGRSSWTQSNEPSHSIKGREFLD